MNLNIVIRQNPTNSELIKNQIFADKNWGEQDESAEEVRENYFDTPKFVVRAYLNKRMVSLANIHIKKIISDGKSITVGGIGGVVTDMEYRHKGIALKVLKKAMLFLKSINADVAMLCTDIPRLGGLYEKVGFIPLGKPYYFLTKQGAEKVSFDGMIAPIGDMKKFKKILESNEKINVGASNF